MFYSAVTSHPEPWISDFAGCSIFWVAMKRLFLYVKVSCTLGSCKVWKYRGRLDSPYFSECCEKVSHSYLSWTQYVGGGTYVRDFSWIPFTGNLPARKVWKVSRAVISEFQWSSRVCWIADSLETKHKTSQFATQRGTMSDQWFDIGRADCGRLFAAFSIVTETATALWNDILIQTACMYIFNVSWRSRWEVHICYLHMTVVVARNIKLSVFYM